MLRGTVTSTRMVVGLLAVLFMPTAISWGQPRDHFRELREKLVTECIEREGVKNPRVLAAMRQVPRHEFVTGTQRQFAYNDTALPIGHKQTISPPFVVAYMTETIDPQPNDKVLEIGTGSGYQAAVLSNLVANVYTIEIVPELGKPAAERLKRLGYKNVTCKVGDGYAGWHEYAPFDKIIVTCSPENVPQPLIDQLAEGGKLLIPLGERYQQVFHLFEKQKGKLESTKLIPTLFVPMTGQSESKRQVKPDPLNPKLLNGDFSEDEDGVPAHWHYQRQAKVVEYRDGSRAMEFENTESGRFAQGLQGMAIDGSKLGMLQFSMRYKAEKVKAGTESYEKPGLTINFYDDQRRTIAEVPLGPWLGTSTDWETVSKNVPVPPSAREMIIRIGLNGGTGKLTIADIQMTVKHR